MLSHIQDNPCGEK